MPQALPYIGLGLGIYQTIQGQSAQNRAIEEARRPRLSTEQQQTIREAGTSNIKSNLANRGLLESSLFPGALAGLEKGIGEATANAGTMGDVPGLLSQQALGMAQSGQGLIGDVSQMYLLRQLLGQTGQPSVPQQPTGYQPSYYNPYGMQPSGRSQYSTVSPDWWQMLQVTPG